MNIKKITASLIPLAIMFSLSSCDPNRGVVGGLYGPIRGIYTFDSYADYLEFYDVFKDYNEERYWVPSSDTNTFEIKYNVDVCPIRLIDFQEKRYDLDFMYQIITAIFNSDNVEIQLTFNSLDVVDFVNIFALDTNLIANGDTYLFNIVHNNDTEIAYGRIRPIETFEDELVFNNYLDEIIELFNISAIDVFM